MEDAHWVGEVPLQSNFLWRLGYIFLAMSSTLNHHGYALLVCSASPLPYVVCLYLNFLLLLVFLFVAFSFLLFCSPTVYPGEEP